MRQPFAIAALFFLGVGCGGGTETPPDGPGGDGGSDGPTEGAVPVAPLAPSDDLRMYQGSQRDFRTQLGTTCKGRVAASMSSTAFCYLAADDNVKCAGRIAGVDHGLTATDVGQTGAEQIMLFFLDNGLCVTKTDRSVQCMGTNTTAFGTGGISTTFGRWTSHDFAAITTGSWDQICGITPAGQVYCGGVGFGNPPVAVGAPGQKGVWVDSGGGAHPSDPMVLRPGESRTECQVHATGLVCGGTTYGPPNGTVVSGSRSSGTSGDFTCWLDSTGTVGCTTGGPQFAPNKVLYLASSYYTDTVCAIYNDGSIWCRGTNSNGKLGTGNTMPLMVETMVAPPGSARVRCE